MRTCHLVVLSLLLGVAVPIMRVSAPEEPFHFLLGQLHVEHLGDLHLQHNYRIPRINQKERWKKPGVTKRCRLSWLTNNSPPPPPNAGGGRYWGSTYFKYIFHVKIQLFITLKYDQNLDSDPNPHRFGSWIPIRIVINEDL
jgi:hypothetical protein